MRLSAAKSHDTLDEASLPPTDNTELNYRTQPLSPQDQQSLTLRVLFSAALFVAPLGLVVSWFLPIKSIAIPLLVTGVVVFLARAFWEFVRSRKPGFELLAGGVIIAASILGWLFHSIPSNRLGYGLAFPLVVIAVACFSLLLAKQIAFWMANHPKVEWEVSRKWEGYFPVLHNLSAPAECPEIRGLIAAPILFVLAYGFGWLVLLRIEETPIWEFASEPGWFLAVPCLDAPSDLASDQGLVHLQPARNESRWGVPLPYPGVSREEIPRHPFLRRLGDPGGRDNRVLAFALSYLQA